MYCELGYNQLEILFLSTLALSKAVQRVRRSIEQAEFSKSIEKKGSPHLALLYCSPKSEDLEDMSSNSAWDHTSRLGLALQGHDQVIAISQAAINMCLNYRFQTNTDRLKIEIHNKKAGTSLVATMSSPTIELSATKEKFYGGNLFLNFNSGNFTYYDFSNGAPKETKLSVKGWAVAISVRFDQQQLKDVPPEVRRTVEKPESYTITQLIIDFSTAYLASSVWTQSTLPGIKSADGEDADLKGMLKTLFETYIESLKSPGDHNILGFALTAGSAPAPKVNATLQPKLTRLQTMYYKQEGKDIEKPEKHGLNAFLIKEMTGDHPMPTDDLTWTGNWFEGTVNGTLVMSHANFWVGYLLQRLAPYNKAMLLAMNSVQVWTLNPQADKLADDQWQLDNSPMPSDDKLIFSSNSSGGQFKWSGNKNASVSSGFGTYNSTTCKTNPTIQIDVTWASNSSNVLINTTAIINYTREHAENITGFMTSFNKTETHKATVTVNWSTTLELASVTDQGSLQVRMTQGTPSCKVNVSDDSRAGYQLWFNPDFKVDDHLSKLTESVISQRLSVMDLVSKIAEDINGQRQGFVFPGGGIFDIKNPVFSDHGDLLLGLTYQLRPKDE